MNKFTHSGTPPLEVLQDRFGLRVAAALTRQQQLQPRPDIDERLRFAREQALARARESRKAALAPAALANGGAAALLPGSSGAGTPWWLRLSSILPLAVLAGGLLLIDRHYEQSQIDAAVEVDAALLSDDLPPEAYRDPGFVEFLKTTRP
jgi:hypothetical protein